MSDMELLVESEETPRTNFTMIPNIVDDLGLDCYAFRLYAHLRRVAGEHGECWQSTRTLAAHCRMSTGRVSAAKSALADAGLIRIEERAGAGGLYHVITIVDIWQRNAESVHHMNANPATPESVHVVNANGESVHHMNAMRSPGERKKNTYKKNPHDEEEPTLSRATRAKGTESTDSVLVPNSPGARLLFAKLQRAAGDVGRRGPRRFATRQQADVFARAEADLGYERIGREIDAALARGITSLKSLVAYLSAIADRVERERAQAEAGIARLDTAPAPTDPLAELREALLRHGAPQLHVDWLRLVDRQDGVVRVSAPPLTVWVFTQRERPRAALDAAAAALGVKIEFVEEVKA